MLRSGRRCGRGSVRRIHIRHLSIRMEAIQNPPPTPDLTPFRITQLSDLLKMFFFKRATFFVAGTKVQFGEGGRRILLGDNRPWGGEAVADRVPPCCSLYFNWILPIHTYIIHSFIKVKFTLQQAKKNQRGSRGIALLFL